MGVYVFHVMSCSNVCRGALHLSATQEDEELVYAAFPSCKTINR